VVAMPGPCIAISLNKSGIDADRFDRRVPGPQGSHYLGHPSGERPISVATSVVRWSCSGSRSRAIPISRPSDEGSVTRVGSGPINGARQRRCAGPYRATAVASAVEPGHRPSANTRRASVEIRPPQ